MLAGLDMLYDCQLVLHGMAVATTEGPAPSNDAAVGQNGNEGASVGLDVLHVLQLSLYGAAVAAVVVVAPSNRRAVKTDGRGSIPSGLGALVLHSTADSTAVAQAPRNN